MQEFLQRIDSDYYRAALLLIARAEFERLRQRRSTAAAATMPGKLLRRTALAADSDMHWLVPPAIAQCGFVEN
jgi:hypothetical protein